MVRDRDAFKHTIAEISSGISGQQRKRQAFFRSFLQEKLAEGAKKFKPDVQ
jgi:hypothetical protein